MFKEAVDKFEPILKQDGVYIISHALIKMANQRFSSIKNDYNLVFDCHTKVQEVVDDEKISTQAFSFSTINQIMDNPGLRTVDFIGVLHHCGGVF